MDSGALYHAIAEVCPIIATTVGKDDDRTTWTFTPAEGATQAQIDAGNNVIQTIPMDTLPPPSPPKAALLDHENRLLALEGQPAITLEQFTAKTKMV